MDNELNFRENFTFKLCSYESDKIQPNRKEHFRNRKIKIIQLTSTNILYTMHCLQKNNIFELFIPKA